VQLGSLQPQDVVVELYLGRVDTRGEIVEGRAIAMHPESNSGGDYVYAGEATPAESGLHGFTIRVRPNHPDLSTPFVPGLIVWANGGRTSAAAR
jgi:glycogen phosphorylase